MNGHLVVVLVCTFSLLAGVIVIILIEKGSDIRSYFSNRTFFLFPNFEKTNKMKETHWLWWTWIKIEEKDPYEEILEEAEVRNFSPDKSSAVRKRRRAKPVDEDIVFNTADSDLARRLARASFDEFFNGGPGFGVFYDGLMIGWAEQSNVNISSRSEAIDVTTRSWDPAFIQGQRETIITVTDLHVMSHVMNRRHREHFINGDEVYIILTIPNDARMDAYVITNILVSGVDSDINEMIFGTVSFIVIGESRVIGL